MDKKKALEKAAYLCSKREVAQSEIETKLDKWSVLPDDAVEVVEYLIKEGYVNNLRYAQSYVRDKYRFNRWGRVKIKYGLRFKEIAGSDISTAMEEINESLYVKNLIDLLKNKRRSLRKEEDLYKKKASMIRYAQSRGFENELIYDCLNNLDRDEEEE